MWYVFFLDLGTTPLTCLDIPAHTYQATFEPNKEWSTFYAAAPEIHKYWKRVVDKYGCMEYVKLKHEIIEAVWDEGKGKWLIKVGNIDVKQGTYGDTRPGQRSCQQHYEIRRM